MPPVRTVNQLAQATPIRTHPHKYVQCRNSPNTKVKEDKRKSSSVSLHNDMMLQIEKEMFGLFQFEKPSMYVDLTEIPFNNPEFKNRLIASLERARIHNKRQHFRGDTNAHTMNEMDDLINAFHDLYLKSLLIQSDRASSAAARKAYMTDINIKAAEHGLKPVKTIAEAKELNEKYDWGIERSDYGTNYHLIERR